MLNHVTFKKCHSNITTSHSEINAIDCILGQTVDFEQTDINTITGALKLYLRELPENILTPELAPEFENAGSRSLQFVGDKTNIICTFVKERKMLLNWESCFLSYHRATN